ncbi:MAG: hypothetical protein JWM74_4972 [Myxococcaceae bacterium]|nr:hypothetical protein [Myxococcaceae bacterium]
MKGTMSDNPYRVAGQRPDAQDSVRRCLYCGCLRAPEGPCARCRAEARPARSDATLPATPPCPRCQVIALAPTALANQEVTVLACSDCRGCFVPAFDWGNLLDRVDAGEQVEGIGMFVPLPPERTRSLAAMATLVRCPACHETMDRANFGGSDTNVVIDICQSHGVWLDATELVAVVRTFAKILAGQPIGLQEIVAAMPEWKREMIAAAKLKDDEIRRLFLANPYFVANDD